MRNYNKFNRLLNDLSDHQIANCRKIESAKIMSFSQAVKLSSAERSEILEKINNWFFKRQKGEIIWK